MSPFSSNNINSSKDSSTIYANIGSAPNRGIFQVINSNADYAVQKICRVAKNAYESPQLRRIVKFSLTCCVVGATVSLVASIYNRNNTSQSDSTIYVSQSGSNTYSVSNMLYYWDPNKPNTFSYSRNIEVSDYTQHGCL